jgi:hypothetical protein
MKMPGGLSTPPASPGKHLPEGESSITEDSQTTEGTNNLKKPPHLTISTSTMHPSLTSLTCATRLSPDAFSPGKRTDLKTNSLELSVVMTPELCAVGELVAAMKRVVGVLGTTFDSLGEQTERVATLAPALKASEQVEMPIILFPRTYSSADKEPSV